MNVVDFLSQLVSGWGFNTQTSEIQYILVIAGINLVVMVVEKIFGLFAIVISESKKVK